MTTNSTMINRPEKIYPPKCLPGCTGSYHDSLCPVTHTPEELTIIRLNGEIAHLTEQEGELKKVLGSMGEGIGLSLVDHLKYEIRQAEERGAKREREQCLQDLVEPWMYYENSSTSSSKERKLLFWIPSLILTAEFRIHERVRLNKASGDDHVGSKKDT